MYLCTSKFFFGNIKNRGWLSGVRELSVGESRGGISEILAQRAEVTVAKHKSISFRSSLRRCLVLLDL